MSTYYYVLCYDHHERADAVSINASGGAGFLADGDRTLLPFLVAHLSCRLRVVSEDNEAAYGDEFRDWTAESVAQEIATAAADNRWAARNDAMMHEWDEADREIGRLTGRWLSLFHALRLDPETTTADEVAVAVAALRAENSRLNQALVVFTDLAVEEGHARLLA